MTEKEVSKTGEDYFKEIETSEAEAKDREEKEVLVQLKHFYNRSCAIHFVLKTGEWRNAIIREVDEVNKRVVLKEFVLGNVIYDFSNIESDSIQEYNLGFRGGRDK